MWVGLGLAPIADAATREFYFAKPGGDRALSQNSVTALAQDPQGFVWVGTQGGLHRYDGRSFVAYRHDPQDPATLAESYVTALAVEGGSALWIGTYSQYVARLDLVSGRIRRFTAGVNGRVAALLPRAGKLWVATPSGVEVLDPVTGHRQVVLVLEPRQLQDTPLQQLVADHAGNVWHASAAGLYRIDPQLRATLVGAAAPTRSLWLDARAQLWVGRRDGLFRVLSDRSLHKVWPYDDADAHAGDHSPVHAITEAPDGGLWLALFGRGLRRYDPVTGRSSRIQEDPKVEASLPDDAANALLLDRGGMLWVGGQFRGVAVTDPRGSRFTYVFDTTGGRQVASDNSIRAIGQSSDGALWLATDNARLRRYDMALDRFDDASVLLRRPDGGERFPRVTAIADAGHSRLWLATIRGLLRLDTDTGLVESIDLGAHSELSLLSLAIDRRGDLWVGTRSDGALHYRRDGGGVTRYPLANPRVNALIEDNRGRIWFGTGNGLDMLDRADGRMRHFAHASDRPDSLSGNLVRALHQAHDGTIWVGGHAGLSRVVEGRGGRIAFANPLVNAPGAPPVPVVFSITQGAGEPLWMGTDVGIVRFDPGRQQVRAYGLADGLQDMEFNGGAVANLGDGRLAFGGIRGLNLFTPSQMGDTAFTPPLRLLSTRIGSDAATDAALLLQPTSLRVPDGAGILRLRIGTLDFAPAADAHYRYRLAGFEDDWIENGRAQDITYTQLPPGQYTFNAQSTDRNGAWTGVALSIPVTVHPPPWRHPLVIAFAALTAIAMLWLLGWRWRQRRARERGYFAQIREREERLKLALWASGEQFWDYHLGDQSLHRLQVDDSSSDTPEIGIHTKADASHQIHADDLAQVQAMLRQHLRGKSALFLSEHRIRDAGSQWRWMRARGRVVERDATGRAVRVSGTARDITASRHAERERRVSSEVLRSMAEAVVVFDGDFAFVSINPAFALMTGYGDAEVIGRSTSVLDSQQHDPEFYRCMRGDLERNGAWAGEIWQQRKDGSEFLCWLKASSVQDDAGERGHYVAVLADITDQKRAEQEMRYLANYDSLTSLPNRSLLSERLSRAIVRARRNGSRIAVLFLDLDRFKDINDSLGHAAGDRILRAAAARLQLVTGDENTVARLGGDEFTIVLENLDSAEEAEQVARDLIAAFEQPLDFDERHEVTISPSIGISLYPDHAHVPADLLKHADTAMYKAKAAGRRTFMRYTDAMDVEIRSRATISAALRKVLDRNELTLAFQPRLSLPEQRITGVEALLRWSSVEHGDIPPSQFIALAEESGLILEIGEWALREACAVLRVWRTQGLLDLTMAVNVSALQLLRGNLPDVVARVLEETGIPAGCLELELTETVIMANAEQTSSTLQAFRRLGIGLAIDDFGTGYSSLAYLKRLPITTLKIDKEFIGDLTHDRDDEAITSAIIAMAHSLGLTVVAEGVETTAQMQFLHQHGCDEIQGYLLARPMKADQCMAFVRAWSPDTGAAAEANVTIGAT